VADEHTELLQGTLEMLVLKTLAFEPMPGSARRPPSTES
jgi:hypothetical protein